MNNDTETKHPDLRSLVGHYQETKAPPGFANRVLANIKEDKKRHLPGRPVFAYAASLGIIALVSFVVINSTEVDHEEPEQQIARQDPVTIKEPAQNKELPQVAKVQEETLSRFVTQPATQAEKQKPAVVIAKADSPVSVKEPASTVSISKQEHELFFQPTAETDAVSLTVLTDISDWLSEQKEIAAPDISDIPDLDEINSLFGTT